MDRRSFALSLVGLSLAGPALAQSTPPAVNDVPAGGAPVNASPAASAPANPAGSAMGEAEQAHIRNTLQVGTLSLEASRLAVNRAHEAIVKQFANFEVAEQETIGEILKPLAGAAPPPDPMQAEVMGKLNASGGLFDRTYVDAQIQGHQKLLEIQDAYISAGKDQTQLDIAKLARGMINEHLELLHEIQRGVLRG